MKMKAKIAALGLLILLSAGLGIAALSQPAAITEAEAAVSAAYTLRDYGGCIAVFRGDEPNPVSITGIETETLNDADRRLLLEGIAVESKNELLLLLEDLGS